MIALLVLCPPILLGGCSKDEPSESACAPGTLACECGPDDACLADEDGTELLCLDGFCVRGDCDPGTEGCVCRDDGTCDALDGVPMTCIGNVCEETELASPGELGGPCGPGIACSEYEGVVMDCVAGVCQIPGCPSGTLGCPCGPFGACDQGPEGEARCSADGFCGLGSCEAGTLGCACAEGGACDEDLFCDNSLCRARNRVFLTIEDASVRACDIVISERGRTVSGVVFSSLVRGDWMYQRPRAALGLYGRADVAITGAVATVIYDDLETITASEAGELVDVECYDRTGTTVEGVEVRVLEVE